MDSNATNETSFTSDTEELEALRRQVKVLKGAFVNLLQETGQTGQLPSPQQLENESTDEVEALQQQVKALKGAVVDLLQVTGQLPSLQQMENDFRYQPDLKKDILTSWIQGNECTMDWQGLPDEWKRDADVACAFLDLSADSRRAITIRTLPISLHTNKKVVLVAIRAGRFSLHDIHDDMKNDVEIALELLSADAATVRITSTLVSIPPESLPLYAVAMQELRLVRSRKFLKKVLKRNPDALGFLPRSQQSPNLDLILAAIKIGFARGTVSAITDNLCRNKRLWMRRDFALAWVCRGYDFRFNRPHLYWQRDRQIQLANAISTKWKFDVVNYTDDDVNILAETFFQYPYLYGIGQGLVYQGDPAVTIIAFSAVPSDVVSTWLTWPSFDWKRRQDDQINFLKSKRYSYREFSTLMSGLVESSGSSLTLLNQGNETKCHYKKLLAEYIGVPTDEGASKWLPRLEQAYQNLQQAIASSEPTEN